MAVISFRFTGETNKEQQDRFLRRLKSLAGVRQADRIDSDAVDEGIARLCFAESVDPAHVPTILDELQRAPGVEGVAIESPRGLV